MKHRVPEPIQPLLATYLFLVQQQHLELLYAFYLEGSIVLGGFNKRFSDIDFVALLTRRVGESELESLRTVHARIEEQFPRW